MNPKVKVWLQFVVTFAVIGLVLFLLAGTINYWQAWIYLGVCAVINIPITFYVMGNSLLLENRTRAGPAAEKRPFQKVVAACFGISSVAIFVVAGLDHRFGWSRVPLWLWISGDILIVVATWMVYRVFKENSYGSATVEIAQGQEVISTGPYAVVRNPMYSSASVYVLAMSLALGSYWSLIPATITILGLVLRLFDEEKFLAQDLPGYAAYCAKVRWHLIPGVF